MPTTVAITNSNGTAWPFASTDTPSVTALGARLHDLGFLTEGSSTPFAMVRPGIFAGAGQGAANSIPGGLFVSPTGTGLNVQVAAGGGGVERGTFSGAAWSTFTPAGTYPYGVALKSTVTFATNSANSLSGTRIDRVDLQIADGPGYSDNSGTSFAQIIYTAGTVGSGVAANAPSHSIPLSLITFPSGTTTTLTSGMFTDMRRGAGIRGAARWILPGDSLADAGFTHGEERMRWHATYGLMKDLWDATTSTWRGQQRIELQAVPGGTVACTANSWNTVASISITDPGWPYLIKTDGQIYYSAGANNVPVGYITLDSNTPFTGIMNATLTTVSNAADFSLAITPRTFPTTQTGAHTIRLIVDSNVAGTCFNGVTNVGQTTWLNVELIPA